MKALKYIEPLGLIQIKENFKKKYTFKEVCGPGEIERVKRKLTNDLLLLDRELCLLLSKHDVLDLSLKSKLLNILKNDKYDKMKSEFYNRVIQNWSRIIDLDFIFRNQTEFHKDVWFRMESGTLTNYVQKFEQYKDANYFIEKTLLNIKGEKGLKNLYSFLMKYDNKNFFKISSIIPLLIRLENVAEKILGSEVDYKSHLLSSKKTIGYLIREVNVKNIQISYSDHPSLYKLIREKNKTLDSMKSLDSSSPERYEYWSQKVSRAESVEVRSWGNTKVAVAMEFGDWVLVEQGPKGNALYCYTKSNFEKIRGMDNWIRADLTYHGPGLQDILTNKGTLIHRQNSGLTWQSKADELLTLLIGYNI